jgi:hypothetical protein
MRSNETTPKKTKNRAFGGLALKFLHAAQPRGGSMRVGQELGDLWRLRRQPEEIGATVFVKRIYLFERDGRLTLISQIPQQSPGCLATRIRALNK